MTDTFRKTYKALNGANSALIVEMKEIAEKLESILRLVASRESSLAITNLEQAMMWGTKAIVLEDEKNGSQALR